MTTPPRQREVGVVVDSATSLKAVEWAKNYLLLSQSNGDKLHIIGVKPGNNTTRDDRGLEAIDEEEDEQPDYQGTGKGRWENVKCMAYRFREMCDTNKVYRQENTDFDTLQKAITDFRLNVLIVGRQTGMDIITKLIMVEEATCTIVVVKDEDTPARDVEYGKDKLPRSSSKKRKGLDDPTRASMPKIHVDPANNDTAV